MGGLVDLGVVGTPTYLELDANGFPQQIINGQGAAGLGGFQSAPVYLTGVSLSTFVAPAGCRQMSIENAGTIGTAIIDLPPNPSDGDVFAISTRSQITTCTFSGGIGGATVRNAPTSPFTAGSTAKWMFSDGSRANSPVNTWIRIA